MAALHAKLALGASHGAGLGSIAASVSGAVPEYLMGVLSAGGFGLLLFASVVYVLNRPAPRGRAINSKRSEYHEPNA